jgi:hypothetical protein
MKALFFLSLFAFCGITAIAQRKHSFTLGGDLVEYSKAKDWRSGNVSTRRYYDRLDDRIASKIALWASYSYKNKYALRFYASSLQQGAAYRGTAYNNEYFLTNRDAIFFDLTAGYNLSAILNRQLPSRLWNKIGVWAYGGASLLGDGSVANYCSYASIADLRTHDWFCEPDIKREEYSRKVAPVAQLLFKYNPIRNVFLGLGGTYHHVAKDFRPVSGNVSVGVQL